MFAYRLDVLIRSSLANTACPAAFCAMFAIPVVFARIARIASCACAASMNLGRVAGFGCCRFQCARREERSEYHGSDDCNSFHVSGIPSLVTVRPSWPTRSVPPVRCPNVLNMKVKSFRLNCSRGGTTRSGVAACSVISTYGESTI